MSFVIEFQDPRWGIDIYQTLPSLTRACAQREGAGYQTTAWQTLRSLPDILRLGVLHCCILGSIIFIMRTRFGRSSTGRSACAYNVRSGTDHLEQRHSFCMRALPCWKSVPKCIRIDLRASKIQKFPGGACPQTLLVAGSFAGTALGALYRQRTRG